MREIVLDTETTGLDPKKGDRLIEIGGIEIFNRIPTGREFHRFINPERDVPAEAQKIHGISTEFLVGKPLFRDVVRDFLAFIGDDMLVIHNAQFDIRFLNHELGFGRARKPLSFDRVVDTLAHCPPPPPGRTEFARRALQALWNRQFTTNQARRVGRQLACWRRCTSSCSANGRRRSGCKRSGSNAAGADRVTAREPPQNRGRQLPSRLTETDVAAHRTLHRKDGGESHMAAILGRGAVVTA